MDKVKLVLFEMKNDNHHLGKKKPQISGD